MNTAKRTKYGGNLIFLAELDSTYQPAGTLTANSNCIAFQCQEESNSPLETSTELLRTEDGLIGDIDQEHTATTTATLLENDTVKTDFLAQTVRGKTYMEGRYIGINNGNYEWRFAIVRVDPLRDDKMPKGKLPYKSTHIAPTSAVTWDSTDLTAVETALSIAIHPTTVTIAAGTEDKTTRIAV